MGAICCGGFGDAGPIANSFYELEAKDVNGNMRSMREWQGKVVLITNVASK